MEIQAKSILVRVSEGFNLTVILLRVAVFIRGRCLSCNRSKYGKFITHPLFLAGGLSLTGQIVQDHVAVDGRIAVLYAAKRSMRKTMDPVTSVH